MVGLLAIYALLGLLVSLFIAVRVRPAGMRLAAVLLTVLVHHPFGKLWNRLVAGGGGACARGGCLPGGSAPRRSAYDQVPEYS